MINTNKVGPIVGHTKSDVSKIWIKGEKFDENDSKLCIGTLDLYDNQQNYQYSKIVFLENYYDYTGVILVDGLNASSFYHFQTGIFYRDSKENLDISIKYNHPFGTEGERVAGSFTTAPTDGDGNTLQFAFGSCRSNILKKDPLKGDRTFQSLNILKENNKLDLVLMTGDQIYSDIHGPINKINSEDEFYEEYKRAFSTPNIRKLMQNVPTYMIWDDHEIRNDWSKDKMYDPKLKQEDIANNKMIYGFAKSAYYSYQHLHNPTTSKAKNSNEKFWYEFVYGKFPFFVMDTRSYRFKKDYEQKGISKTMLGEEQLKDLLTWIEKNKDAPVKFIVSSNPFFPDKKDKDNTELWGHFSEERKQILDCLYSNNCNNTIILSGDIHNSAVSILEHRDNHFKVVNLISSPFYWGAYFEDFEFLYEKEKELYDGEYKYTTSKMYGQSDLFMHVDVNLERNPIVLAQIYNGKPENSGTLKTITNPIAIY
ncbi:MAG: alkaline phosphatase D family protein [Bacteroidota bacterium]